MRLFSENPFILNAGQTVTQIEVNITATGGTLIEETPEAGAPEAEPGNSTFSLTGTLAVIRTLLEKLGFRPDDNFFGAAKVEIEVHEDADPTNSATVDVAINVTPVNDVPFITANTLSIDGGQARILTTAELNASDPVNSADELQFTASNVTRGQFEFVDAPGVPITDFTLADVPRRSRTIRA